MVLACLFISRWPEPRILNNISTNVSQPHLLSYSSYLPFPFFGLFDITLPASLSGTADHKGRPGQYHGHFYGLTLAIVSFSCWSDTGSLLAGSLTASGASIQLTAGMAESVLALAYPLASLPCFRTGFPPLPKNRGLAQYGKKSFGIRGTGAGIEILSNADLVKHWGLLKRRCLSGCGSS